MTKPTIAFIGLGNMGGPMAANLVAAGHRVTGFDPSAEASDRAAAAGVETAPSVAEAAADASVVITMLPSGAHLLDVYGERGRALEVARPGALFVDCSTIAVSDARTAAQRAIENGHRALDAPVSGGVGGATDGTLTLMVGGEAADLDSARPILDALAKRIVHCGASGAGQAAKICNNLILGASMVAVSEAFVLGEHLGLTHQALFDVASVSSGQCWALTTNCPVPGPVPSSPANAGFAAGFATQLMAKDLDLAMRAADERGVEVRLGALANMIYRDLGLGAGAGLDFSAVVEDIRQRSASTWPES